MDTEERNEAVKKFLASIYQKAEDDDFLPDETQYRRFMDKLFQTTVWGFREIVLVAIVGMKLDPAYRPSAELYRCNPRALYEGPIKEFFIEKGIPHRKSGPLNVAKAAVGLDLTWATQRRPSDVAKEVVSIVRVLESASDRTATLEAVGVSLMRRLIAHAQILSELAVESDPTEDPEHLYFLCRELITRTPDAGNTPQKIAALLLKSAHEDLRTGITVTGGDDRAFVTSTTSKKPGDLNEERDGEIYKVYEVTVKPFDLARIRDSYDCISIYQQEHGIKIREVSVLCRQEDCPQEMTASDLCLCRGQYEYQDVVYHFLDIYEWIAYLLQRMRPEGRRAFHELLNLYINETNTAETVKRLWRDLHTGE